MDIWGISTFGLEGYARLPVASSWKKREEIRVSRDGSKLRYQLFRGDPSWNDIQQGALGDCYFLSALAVVATRQDILNKIFVSKETNSIGAYQVRLCKDGSWKIITVDSLFLSPGEARLLTLRVPATNSGQLYSRKHLQRYMVHTLL